MQPELKKSRHPRQVGRWPLLALLVTLAAGLLLGSQQLQKAPVSTKADAPLPQDVTLCRYDPDDVSALTITRSGERPWTVLRDEDGLFVLQGDDEHQLSAATTSELANAACILVVEEVLTEDPADYAGHLADYGLDTPDFIAEITYADGKALTLRVGSPAAHTNAWRYMLVDGDDRLFAFSRGMVQDLFVSEASLRDISQPLLHKARIDRITLSGPDGLHTQWQLDTDITATDAIDRWRLTAPFAYPADATAMEALLTNAANLRLGTWLAPATAANLSAYGFDAPRLTIELHMAPGTIATTGMDGAVSTQDFPEGTCTFVIGGAESDMIDYVRHGNDIYRCSHFTLTPFLGVDPAETMSRYLLPVALGNLASLTIDQDGQRTEYVLTRTEQVAANNELVYDENGQIVYNVTLTRNGEAYSYQQFSAAYQSLVTATVSGILPAVGHATTSPHTIYTFTDTDGSVHTVALSTFDALHDAVSVDGHEAFYLIKNGFSLELE